ITPPVASVVRSTFMSRPKGLILSACSGVTMVACGDGLAFMLSPSLGQWMIAYCVVRHSSDILSRKVARHAAQPRTRMRRRADVVEARDDSPVLAGHGERPPQMNLAECASARIGIAADEVDVVALEIGWREHRGLRRRSFEVHYVATEPPQHAPGVGLGEIRGPVAGRG